MCVCMAVFPHHTDTHTHKGTFFLSSSLLKAVLRRRLECKLNYYTKKNIDIYLHIHEEQTDIHTYIQITPNRHTYTQTNRHHHTIIHTYRQASPNNYTHRHTYKHIY